jgi:hypothetical protein
MPVVVHDVRYPADEVLVVDLDRLEIETEVAGEPGGRLILAQGPTTLA